MRLIRLFVFCLSAAVLLSACAPSLSATTTATEATVPSLTVTTTLTLLPTPTFTPSIDVDPTSLRGVNLTVWHAFTGLAYEVFTNRVAQFNATNEWGIQVNPTSYSDYSALGDGVGAALVSSSSPPPNLVAALPHQILTWAASEMVVDLQPYLNDPEWGFGEAAIADIPAAFLAQDHIEGWQLGLPAQRSARFLFYNRTWAEELGFDAPPATADEFRQQACAANAAYRNDSDLQNDGYGGWVVDSQWQTAYSWLLAFGGNVVNGDAYEFNTAPNLAALKFIKGLFDDHCAWLSTEPTPFDSFARRSALFVTGDLASISLEAESMSRLGNADEWTAIPFPGPEGQVVVAYGPSYALLTSTLERQMASWLFVRWLLSPENQAQWVEATGLYPLRNSLFDMVGPYRTAFPQWEAAVRNLSAVQGVPQLASWGQARYVLEDGLTVIFQMNTPADQLPSMLDEMETMVGEVGKR